MYTTYLFDLDGTLLDTAQDLTDAVNHILVKYGYPTCSREAVVAATGNGARELVAGCLPEGEAAPQFQTMLEDFRTYYEAHSCIKTAPYEEIMTVLEKLKGEGCKVAIVSNKPHGAVCELAERFFPGIPAFGERSGIPRKPAPDMIVAALAELEAKREGAVYIGDSEVDVATAKNADMPLIAVSWGFRSRELLVSLGATQIADTAEEVLHFPVDKE
ncbi:MAG: HAD family hydrolase [Oscillospiraceae bacterium]|nr:HAD family hydrolase [Oscillospiraceae bacterium]